MGSAEQRCVTLASHKSLAYPVACSRLSVLLKLELQHNTHPNLAVVLLVRHDGRHGVLETWSKGCAERR